MEPPRQDAPGYYVWDAPGSPVVHLHLDVADGVLAEVMRGFAAVPKRGAEVGGLLLGTVEPGARTLIRIDDFEPVDCSYARGPSYLLSDSDAAEFEEIRSRWQRSPERAAYAVGFYRSHTRGGLSLALEDLDLLDRYFPEPSTAALLIKPFGTKPCLAGFFFREDGVFQENTPLEFPFRRRELSGEEPPPRRSLEGSRARRRSPEAFSEQAFSGQPSAEAFAGQEPSDIDYASEAGTRAGHAYAITTPARGRLSGPLRGWLWLPLSFVFLLLGVLLGFQAALTMSSKASAGGSSDFSLGLGVAKTGDNLTLKWNRDSPAIAHAQRGVLEIQDGNYPAKPLDLKPENLQTGSVIYNNSSKNVRFRLTVYENPRVTVTESLNWTE